MTSAGSGSAAAAGLAPRRPPGSVGPSRCRCASCPRRWGSLGVTYLVARARTRSPTPTLYRPPSGLALAALRQTLESASGPPASLIGSADHAETPLGARCADALAGRPGRVPRSPPDDHSRARTVLPTSPRRWWRCSSASRRDGRSGRRLRDPGGPGPLHLPERGLSGNSGRTWSWPTGRAALRDSPGMRALGRFAGQGLQLINVLRDLPRDLRIGGAICRARAARALGLAPADLLDPGAMPRARPPRRPDPGRARASRRRTRTRSPCPAARHGFAWPAPGHSSSASAPSPGSGAREPPRSRRHGEGAAGRGPPDPRPLRGAGVVRPRSGAWTRRLAADAGG